jgi:NADH-quinone oxidoreductase subunit F
VKISSIQDLRREYQKLARLLDLRKEDAARGDLGRREILVCGGTGCTSSDSKLLLANLKREIEAAGLGDKVSAHISGCFGFCEKGPIVKIFPDDVFYIEVSPENAGEIVSSHIKNNQLVQKLLYEDPARPGIHLARQHEIPFYQKQMRIALRNCGLIDPENMREYLAAQGYQALAQCLAEYTPQQVIDIMKASGLRGRGGGGFPTGVKWEAAYEQPAGKKYVVCNADEGDPGAFMDRSILEGDPHSIIEAMAIAAYAVGADEGYVYIRAEYPLAIERLSKAIDDAGQRGLLGSNLMNTGFSFQLKLRYGAGAFVCGEETALLRSIEGKRGEPTTRPPFPAQSGLWGRPTIINNVETLANVPPIILRGAEWFSSIGSEKSKGTKVFALAGKINNVGLVEVPMGISLREIIYEIGGGVKNGKSFKAVQTGGPSGGCIDAGNLDVRIDYDNLNALGSMMGSGGMIVIDEDNCMVDLAKFYQSFTMDESCGKCTPCRIGNRRLHELLDDVSKGKGTPQHLEKLKELSQVIKDTALCGLGQTSPNPILSTMRYFAGEYRAHVYDKTCPAKVCSQLLKFFITDACIGCGRCTRHCPAGCISGEPRKRFVIDSDRCLKCGACQDSCPKQAVERQ